MGESACRVRIVCWFRGYRLFISFHRAVDGERIKYKRKNRNTHGGGGSARGIVEPFLSRPIHLRIRKRGICKARDERIRVAIVAGAPTAPPLQADFRRRCSEACHFVPRRAVALCKQDSLAFHAGYRRRNFSVAVYIAGHGRFFQGKEETSGSFNRACSIGRTDSPVRLSLPAPALNE